MVIKQPIKHSDRGVRHKHYHRRKSTPTRGQCTLPRLHDQILYIIIKGLAPITCTIVDVILLRNCWG